MKVSGDLWLFLQGQLDGLLRGQGVEDVERAVAEEIYCPEMANLHGIITFKAHFAQCPSTAHSQKNSMDTVDVCTSVYSRPIALSNRRIFLLGVTGEKGLLKSRTND